MYQVAFIGNDGYFDVKFVENDVLLKDVLKGMYKEQICSIAEDYVRRNTDDFEFKEGTWERVLTVDGELVCREDVEELEGLGFVRRSDIGNYRRCDKCGKWHKRYGMKKINDAETGEVLYFCDSCLSNNRRDLFTCPECGEIYIHSNFENMVSGHIICDDCFSSSDIESCELCGELFFRRDLHLDIDDRLVCYSCDDFDGCYIDDYQHNRDLEPMYLYDETEEEKKRMIGIELEIGRGPCRDEALAKYCIDTMDGNLVCKYDGSINGDGFEMVTNPFTYGYYEKMMPAWSKILKKCEKRGFESGTRANTGMHIHINRPWFGEGETRQENIDKLLYVFEGFWKNIVEFSRRDYEKVRDWAKRYADGRTHKYKKDDIKEKSKCGDRYRAVNLTNRGTVEIRIFNGTLDENQFFANVQLVKRLMDIVTTMPEKDFIEITWREIINGDDSLTYLKEFGNKYIGEDPDVKLKEKFEDLEPNPFDSESSDIVFKEFPAGTMVRININENRNYRPGVNAYMKGNNGKWICIDDMYGEEIGGEVMYRYCGFYYTIDMFDAYVLPSGTELTTIDLNAAYPIDCNVNRYMTRKSLQKVIVEEQNGKKIYIKGSKQTYLPYMFKELSYINKKIGWNVRS